MIIRETLWANSGYGMEKGEVARGEFYRNTLYTCVKITY
jgi:hypothetical protein